MSPDIVPPDVSARLHEFILTREREFRAVYPPGTAPPDDRAANGMLNTSQPPIDYDSKT